RDNSWTLRPLLDEEAYYYRGSACATPDGRPQCDALESATPLEEIWRRALPARESMPGLGYDTSRVEVTLYRVVRRP
ncbi:MAG: hypothetical protein OEY14_10220, partial [Myxococcales bacterium]|nr:hypothetical protein [Myxococcales bacterium]